MEEIIARRIKKRNQRIARQLVVRQKGCNNEQYQKDEDGDVIMGNCD